MEAAEGSLVFEEGRQEDLHGRGLAVSVTKTVGRCTLSALIVYLFVKGALVLRPAQTAAAMSALITALIRACGASTSPTSSPEDGAALEERQQGDLVSHGQGYERREGNVDPGVLDDAQVLGVKARQFGGLLLR